jgi:hypothetical protein
VSSPSRPDPDAIDALEQVLGTELPTSYREFLLRFNGGRPRVETLAVPGLPGSPTDVQVLFGLGTPVETSDLRWNLLMFHDRLGSGVLPIACDSGGNVFGLRLTGDQIGSVSYWDLEAGFGDPESIPTCYAVAESFESFLNALGLPE